MNKLKGKFIKIVQKVWRAGPVVEKFHYGAGVKFEIFKIF